MLKKISLPILALVVLLMLAGATQAQARVHWGVYVGPSYPAYGYYPAYPYPYGYPYSGYYLNPYYAPYAYPSYGYGYYGGYHGHRHHEWREHERHERHEYRH